MDRIALQSIHQSIFCIAKESGLWPACFLKNFERKGSGGPAERAAAILNRDFRMNNAREKKMWKLGQRAWPIVAVCSSSPAASTPTSRPQRRTGGDPEAIRDRPDVWLGKAAESATR